MSKRGTAAHGRQKRSQQWLGKTEHQFQTTLDWELKQANRQKKTERLKKASERLAQFLANRRASWDRP